jgi:glycosyltransferase involved in cell wall biosynthesis
VAYFILPFYKHAYTVGPALAHVFSKKHHIPFTIIRNVPYIIPLVEFREKHPKILLYQGALNEGRGIEALLEAMTLLPDGFALWLAGEGDLSADLRARAMSLKLDQKVRFLGFIKPEALKDITDQAWLGLNLLENKGESYYYSLANKFFDYVQARIPMLTMNFPEYAALNQQYKVAVLMDDLNPKIIAEKIQELANKPDLYRSLQSNCDSAAQEWNWENERVVLLELWKNV